MKRYLEQTRQAPALDGHEIEAQRQDRHERNVAAELAAMIDANLIAERVAVESYRQMIRLIGEKDQAMRRLLQNILADEERHAGLLKDWMLRAGAHQ